MELSIESIVYDLIYKKNLLKFHKIFGLDSSWMNYPILSYKEKILTKDSNEKKSKIPSVQAVI